MATSTVSLPAGVYTSLGSGPALISPEAVILIVADSSQPSASAIGHAIGLGTTPRYVSLAEALWARPAGSTATTAVVTT